MIKHRPLTVTDELIAYAEESMRGGRAPLTLEHILTSPDCFALTTATPVQRAFCRVVDGLPLGELAECDDVATAFGGANALAALPDTPPAELYALAGIRGGKSLIAAALGVRASQVCDVSKLRPGEPARVSIVSLKLDLAAVVHQHLVGGLRASSRLSSLLIAEPTADTVVLRHPSGHPIEVKCVAGARAGHSLVARWCAGAVFDEFPRMVGADEGVVNFDDERHAVSGRMLPGAQLMALGSPWGPFGPAYKVVREHFGHPSHDVVVMRATGPMMNPDHWTPAKCEEVRRRDHIAYKTDVLGEFADAETSLFGQWELESLCRRAPEELLPNPHWSFAAAIDPAAQTDAFALVVVTRIPDDRWRDMLAVVLVRSWEPPLSPDAVLGEIASILKPYRISRVATDQWSAAALKDLGVQHGLTLEETTITAPIKVDMFESLKTLVADRRIQLAPSEPLLEDLRRVKRKLTATGVRIEFPRIGGRHCDYASALALACAQSIAAPEREEQHDEGWHNKRALAKRLQREARELD